MSLRKRGGIWWIDVSAPNGKRVRRTTETANKALAQEFHDRVKSELWRVAKLSAKPQYLWNDAAVRWLKEHAHKATAGEDVTKLRWLHAHLGGRPLAVISRSMIDAITDAKLEEGVSNSTANRLLELVRAILRKCVDDWEWLERAPKIRMLKEPVRRIRFLPQEEAQRLITALPEHLAAMASFSLSTGCVLPTSPDCSGRRWIWCDG